MLGVNLILLGKFGLCFGMLFMCWVGWKWLGIVHNRILYWAIFAALMFSVIFYVYIIANDVVVLFQVIL